MPAHIEIAVSGADWPARPVLRALASNAISAVCKTIGAACQGEISMLFADDATIRELNRKWRGKDSATNVLSFPGGSGETDAPRLFGDIAFALETVRSEADIEGKSFEHHLSHLMIHGFLHLLGYDHENDGDAATMETLEIESLALLGIGDPYR